MPTDPSTVTLYDFPWPDADKGYSLFPPELENDPLVFFHGTPRSNLEPIMEEGFKSGKKLNSVSYARKSVTSLDHIMRVRHEWEKAEAVIFVVRFEHLDEPKVAHNTSDIHVYNPDFQPQILGFCIVPENYEHR